MSAARYPLRFGWWVHSFGTPDSYGEKPDVYADPVDLWGGYDGERTSSPIDWRGATDEQVDAAIRVQNYPTVKPLDYLVDPVTGEEWIVKGVVRGNNEILVSVYR